jgi:hypothetical protein
MSKRIRLNENLILRESLRTVDRSKNEMFLFLSIEPLFGAAYTSEIAAASTKEQLYISAALNQRLWDLNKDASREDLLANVFGFLDYYYATARTYFAWQDAAEIETVPNPIENGDPVTQLKAFAGDSGRIAELKAEKILGDTLTLFRTLYDKGITSVVLEDA